MVRNAVTVFAVLAAAGVANSASIAARQFLPPVQCTNDQYAAFLNCRDQLCVESSATDANKLEHCRIGCANLWDGCYDRMVNSIRPPTTTDSTTTTTTTTIYSGPALPAVRSADDVDVSRVARSGCSDPEFMSYMDCKTSCNGDAACVSQCASHYPVCSKYYDPSLMSSSTSAAQTAGGTESLERRASIEANAEACDYPQFLSCKTHCVESWAYASTVEPGRPNPQLDLCVSDCNSQHPACVALGL